MKFTHSRQLGKKSISNVIDSIGCFCLIENVKHFQQIEMKSTSFFSSCFGFRFSKYFTIWMRQVNWLNSSLLRSICQYSICYFNWTQNSFLPMIDFLNRFSSHIFFFSIVIHCLSYAFTCTSTFDVTILCFSLFTRLIWICANEMGSCSPISLFAIECVRHFHVYVISIVVWFAISSTIYK